MDISIRQCCLDDFPELQQIARCTYDDTFRSMNSPETMDKYLEDAFSTDKILSELNDMNSAFFFATVDNKLAGYTKLNEAPSQSDINDPTALEIERIYVLKEYKGKGVGRKLIEFAITQAMARNKKYVWLGVWEKNEEAIAFYSKMGFYKFGQHHFRMGDELQSDLVMKRDIMHVKKPNVIFDTDMDTDGIGHKPLKMKR